MAKQTLRQKIATGIAAAGISLAAICGGCEDPQGNMALAALGNMAQASPYTSASDKVAGAGLSTIGQMGHQMNTAQAGRNQVNVYTNNNANQPTASDSSIQYVTDHKMNDGSTYTGSLKPNPMNNNVSYPHGHGVCTWPNGTKYEGEYRDGEYDHGVYTWPDGKKYEGEYKDNMANGHGVMTWLDGARYEGEWKDGNRNGFGKMVYWDNSTKEGAWRDDVFVGSQSQVTAGDKQKSQGGSSKFGFVNVTADDPTFEVFADGAFVGNSPAKLKLSEGPHTIEVRKEGFKDYKKEISVTDGSELNLRAVLEKQ